MTKLRAGMHFALLALAAATLVACGGDDSTSTAPGTLKVGLTDAPACGFAQVNVTVERVRVHRSSTASDSDAGWVDIPVNVVRKLDLLSLMNGIVADLGQTTLSAGVYTQLRLILRPNTGTTHWNSVVPAGGSELPLDTPSGAQSGLKLTPGFTVAPGQLTDIAIDFDACRSVVERGNGTYGLKPVLSVIPQTGAAIQGYVQTGVTGGVTVSAQKGGVVLRSTQANSSGLFVLAPVDPASTPYDVVFTASGRTTSVMTGVPATINTTTNVSALAAPLPMPVSDSGLVNGSVVTSGPPATPNVRALQKLTPTLTIQAAYTNVKADGSYSLALPVAAPLLAPYPVPPGTFAASGGAAKYTLEASALPEYAAKLGSEITVSSSTPLNNQNFTLP